MFLNTVAAIHQQPHWKIHLIIIEYWGEIEGRIMAAPPAPAPAPAAPLALAPARLRRILFV